MALLNVDKRAEADRVARQIEYVELTVEPDFEKQFAAAMHFPHMTDSFPHLQKMLDKATHDRAQRLLLNNPLFGGLSVRALRQLAVQAQEVRFRKNQAIFAEGSEPEALYVVKEGSVTLAFPADGAGPLELKEGGVLNGAAVVNGRPHRASAKANALNTRLLSIPRAAVAGLLEAEGEWRARLTNEGS